MVETSENFPVGIPLKGKGVALPYVAYLDSEKITNLDNGLSLIIKINDRHKDNSTLIQVSRKVASGQSDKYLQVKSTFTEIQDLAIDLEEMRSELVAQSLAVNQANQTMKEQQEQIIRRICDNLVTHGYLFLGHAEGLLGLDLPLKPVSPTVYQRMP